MASCVPLIARTRLARIAAALLVTTFATGCARQPIVVPPAPEPAAPAPPPPPRLPTV